MGDKKDGLLKEKVKKKKQQTLQHCCQCTHFCM